MGNVKFEIGKATERLRTTVLMNNDVYITYVETVQKNETIIVLDFFALWVIGSERKDVSSNGFVITPIINPFFGLVSW